MQQDAPLQPANFRINVAETLVYATYYAPRGRQRLYLLGAELARRYLYAGDLIIGIIGAAGSGKSTLIRGLFPGLELTNDDNGVNVRRALIYDFEPDDFYAPHTFHLDVRYELAFHQIHEIAAAVTKAVSGGRRVIIEHFDQIYEALGYNAQIIFGVGEEIIVTRPNVFGPRPARIRDVVERTILFRLMAHSAEDITTMILTRDYDYQQPVQHSDVRHGFVINFSGKPAIDLDELESKVLAIIRQDVPIQAAGENHIRIGEHLLPCTGTRTHVTSSGQIENFRLWKDFKHHPVFKEYMLVGMVGHHKPAGLEELSDAAQE